MRKRAAGGWINLILALALFACGGGGTEPRWLDLGTDVLVADVDGDGRGDVVTLTHLFGDRTPQGQLAVHRQTANGAFAAPEIYAVGCYPWSMTMADIDGDGRPDLVVTDVGAWNCAEPLAGNAVYFLRQDPANPGHFVAPQKLLGGVSSYQVAIGDFTGDGVPDLVTGGLLSDRRQLVLLAQDPAARGSFLPPTLVPMPGSVAEIVASDIDGDGHRDLFFHMYNDTSGSALAVMMQLPAGGFGPAVALTPEVGLNAQRLAVVDVNGDGRPDLLAHFQPQSSGFSPKLTVLLQGVPSITWSLPVDTSLVGIERTEGTAFGDLDADGQPDLALTGWTGSGGPYGSDWHIDSQVNLLLRMGPAGYALASVARLPIGADRVAIGDIDGDGRNDIVLFGGTSEVVVMLQSHVVAGSFGEPRPLP